MPVVAIWALNLNLAQIDNMRKRFLLPLALLAFSCQNDGATSSSDNLISAETFTTQIGKDVYGVRLKVASEKKLYLGYEVSLYLEDKVWIDTLYLDIPPGDTVESELIFTQAEPQENIEPEIKTKRLYLEQ